MVGSYRLAMLNVVAMLIALATALLVGSPSLAVIQPRVENPEDHEFPRPAFVRKQVRFWQKIFGRYPSTTVIVHESSDPDRIIDVIDYKAFAIRDDKTMPVPRKEREDVTQKYLKRYTKALEHFEKEHEGALRYGAIEKRVYAVYRDDPAGLKRLYDGDLKFRAQTGLADDFLQAAKTAQSYLPFMEKTFAHYGLPRRVARLPFVESMFNLKARSKVGASGIWQFMPDTARNFIFVNSLVDERNSPIKATRAAAQFLLDNYHDLGSWPLAITAYNHGKLGMAKAVKQLGTDNIGRIIESYESPTFGFASKNFYAEFLAAADTYDKLSRQHLIKGTVALPRTESVILPVPLTVAQLIARTKLSREALAALNPCLLESSLTVNQHKPLPAFYELQVPIDMAAKVKFALRNLKDRRTNKEASL